MHKHICEEIFVRVPATSLIDLKNQTIFESDLKIISLSYEDQYLSESKVELVTALSKKIAGKVTAVEEIEVLNERDQRISKVASDPRSFKEFIPAVNNIYLSLLSNLKNYEDSKKKAIERELHTIKGLLGIFGFTSCAVQIHKIEEYLVGSNEDRFLNAKDMIIASQNLYEKQINDLSNLLLIDSNKNFEFNNIKKNGAINEISQKDKIPSLGYYPVEKVLQKYVGMAQSLADRFKDKKIKITFDHCSDEISYEEAQLVDSVLIHLLRNSIDHGIELSYERVRCGKSEIGEIKIFFKRIQNTALEIIFSDDGRGICADFLATKAVSKGLWTEAEMARASSEDKLGLIFKSGFSTKEQATDLSGRGVGMDAIKDIIESLGGNIHFKTEVGLGTAFSFIVQTRLDR